MGCLIAENIPLKQLRIDLGLPAKCHSLRAHCIQGYKKPLGDYTMGIPGAALGYCQALFNYAGDPAQHTERVCQLLSEINAPWANSHELFWGFKRQHPPAEFVQQAMQPLRGTGRIPILITALDPATERSEIESILSTEPAVHPGETILVRLVLNSEQSVREVASLLTALYHDCQARREMPRWWPLLQGEVTVDEWHLLKHLLGDVWQYVNIAVNPFTGDAVWKCIQEQVTVGQIAIGLAEGMSEEGIIQLAPGMRIGRAPEGASYALKQYIGKLATLESIPTLIVLGPSQPEWSEAMNIERVQKLLPLLQDTCQTLWGDISPARRKHVWEMTA